MLGERIREIRKNNQMNQTEFANLIGVSQGTLSELEQNKFNPSLETILAIINGFNVNATWFLLGHTSKKEGNRTAVSELSQMEHTLILEFRKLTTYEQCEILKIIEIKNARSVKRYD